jgi:Na+:H+ antiporter, NhaA family
MPNQSSTTHVPAADTATARVGFVLLGAAALAIALFNSPFAWLYEMLLSVPFSIRLGAVGLEKPLLLWINDGLMAVFFLLVGIEIKRERLTGQFLEMRQAVLPVVAAIGGMAVPAALFAARAAGDADALRGWAIPCATDIAFALGVLAMVGRGVPPAVRTFLTAVAVIDDLLSIIVIAVFYTSSLAGSALAVAGGCVVVLAVLNRRGVTSLLPYLLVGAVMWVAVLKSGVHATLAGVILAMAIPLRAKNEHGESPALELEHAIQPWVQWFVLPIFAFANAGLAFAGMSFAALFEPVPSAILLGLALGKPIGIVGGIWLALKLGISAPLPGANGRHLLGIGLLGGIGFTMSLFIGSLAYSDAAHLEEVRLGVLAASLLTGVAGYLVLRKASSAMK